MFPTEYYRVIRREPNLVGYWRMGGSDTTGTRAADFAGKYGLNGIYNGSPESRSAQISATENEVGYFSPGSKQFGGENQNMEVPDAVPLRITEQMSIEGWITSLKESQESWIIGKMNNNIIASPYFIRLASGSRKMIFSIGNGITNNEVTSSKSIPVSVPIHFVVSMYKNKTMKIFINGVEEASGQFLEAEIKDSEKPVYIGETGLNSFKFSGMIGDLALYNKPLGMPTIKEHFAIGRQIIYKKPYYTTYDPPSYS